MTECISLPRPVSDSSSTTSTRRQRAPANRYSPSPARSSRRWIATSGTPRPRLPSLSSRTSSTSAWPPACRPGAPPKMTSCIDWPRIAPGDCSPSAHSTASVTLDLPEPLGPTMTLTPGPNSSLVRSGKDLKPLTVMDFRYTAAPYDSPACCCFQASFGHGLQRRLRGLLLGILLGAPHAAADLLAADRGLDGEGAVGRRALFVDHGVAHQLSSPRQPLLQRRLVVHRVLERVLDLRRGRVHHRLGGRVVAEGQITGADHRLDDRGQNTLGGDERLEPRRRRFRRRGAQPVGNPEALGHRPARATRHCLCADLGQPARPEAL